MVLSHPEGYEGWVVLHRYAEIGGLSGGFFGVDQEHEPDWLALVELERYVDSLR